MTQRIYYTDAYRTAFDAHVLDASDDGLRVYLDETAFYPTSGGQPHDLGMLGGVSVVDVIDEDDRIAHVLATPLAMKTGAISATIDWERRYDHMQQHTAQHLLSAVVEDLFGFKTVSVHFGPDSSTIDFETDSITRRQLLGAETRANQVVAEAHGVSVTFEDAQSATGLRKASDREGTLRIVSIDAVDRSACGGTHVRTTAELGPILIRSMEKVRKATRVEFVAGSRALRRARRDYETLNTIAGSMSSAIDDVGPLVAAQADRLKDAESTRKKLERELAAFRVRERYEAATPDANGVRTIVVRDAATMDDVKTFAQAAFAFSKVVVIGVIESPASVFVASSEDSGVDSGKLLKERLAAVGGRGGGSPRMAQGSVPSVEALSAMVAGLIG
ncbi:MAG TPA: DHHA1 domain-containing protein [Gemmatimonadaceae bacterium]|jgi:alanyl-tRNA synthetase